MNYSNDYLQQLARENPNELIRIINDLQTHCADLTFAAEYARGIDVEDKRPLFEALMKLLEHDNAVVREGAIYGLCRGFQESGAEFECAIFNKLKDMIYEDSSDAIRKVAKESLLLFDDYTKEYVKLIKAYNLKSHHS